MKERKKYKKKERNRKKIKRKKEIKKEIQQIIKANKLTKQNETQTTQKDSKKH